MIKRELAKDDRLKNEDWSRYLPKFQRRTQTSAQLNQIEKKKAKKWKQKKEYNPFPPPPVDSKVRSWVIPYEINEIMENFKRVHDSIKPPVWSVSCFVVKAVGIQFGTVGCDFRLR